ncbi:MAG: putative toxin-antitoxin system toxin component, PIN family [Betaproteobacteria bacterium]|nr:MAG: putative toxin-antitoxin system toxin component, PIN family [Betaproteobacteria bacterium]
MSRVPCVVLDTNTVLSALVFAHGRLAALRDAWKNRACEPLVSTSTADELIRALTYPKFKLDPAEQNELLADYLPWCRTVVIPDEPPKTPPCRDPFDIPFLQLAVVGKADFLVTGDADLLSIKAKIPFKIVTPDALLTKLAAAR